VARSYLNSARARTVEKLLFCKFFADDASLSIAARLKFPGTEEAFNLNRQPAFLVLKQCGIPGNLGNKD
jgi:hypothetical protein